MKKILMMTLALILSGLPGLVTAEGEPAGALGAQNRPAVTASEQIAQADAIQKRASQQAQRLSKMLSEARRDKDIIRVNCLNRKLTETNATADTINQRVQDLNDAAAGNEDGRRNHESTVLNVLAQKLDGLDQEAAQCLGQGVYEPGASQVVTTISPNAPTGNVSGLPNPPADPPNVTVPPPIRVEGDGPREEVTKLRGVGLLAANGTPTKKEIEDAQFAYQLLAVKRLETLKKDVADSKMQFNLHEQTQQTVSSSQQRSDAFLSRNWIDIHGDVVQLTSKILKPDVRTIQKAEYTYRATGQWKGISIAADRTSFNKALPEDWTTVFKRGLNDPANLAGGSPEYWRVTKQVSFYSPSAEGCLICMNSQYNDPGINSSGKWDQARLFTLSARPDGGASTVLMTQTFDVNGALTPGADQLALSYGNSLWNYSVTNGGGTSTVMTLQVTALSELGRTRLELDGKNQGWSGLLDQVGQSAAGSYLELVFKPNGGKTVDLLISPEAFQEALR